MPDLDVVYDELSRRLSRHEAAFRASDNPTDANAARSRKEPRAQTDGRSDATTYLLLGAPTEKYPDGQMFASVRRGRRYVSYYLFSLYLEPGQLDGLSPQLRKRMQGKTCFNFSRVDADLFDEIDALTDRGRELYAERGLLAHG
jgi:hypothetical protein